MCEQKDSNENFEEVRRIESWEAEQVAGGAVFAKYDGYRRPQRPVNEWIDVLS